MAARAPGADPRPLSLVEAGLMPQIEEAVVGLDRWFDSQRAPGGYGGPVAHWWRDCLDYTGLGLDWRYEGIIIGYLNLWGATGDKRWLAKAKRAGDDLVAGQLPSGNYRNSCFELNPNTGGTPHEATCDLALLRLATALRTLGDPEWERYFKTAERNLTAFCIGRLWDEGAHSFRDDPAVPSFVPNKAATLAEALFAYARLQGDDEWIRRYALPTLEAVRQHQAQGGELAGGICQNSFGARRVEKFFPYYIARCIPALLEGYAWTHAERYASAARQAALFILRGRYADGSFSQVIYTNGRVNRYPQWVAATGDMLRALDLARQVGVEYDARPTLRWLLAGCKPDGSFCTAVGFGKTTLGGQAGDPRDNVSVCGWADKAFRCLTSMARPEKLAQHGN